MALGLGFGLGLSRGGAGEVSPPSPPVALTPPDAALDLFGITVSRIGSGTSSTFTTDYDWEAARAALTPVNTFWVDNATGNNNNDGSQGSPFRSIDLALKMVLDTGVLGCVKVKGAVAGQPRQRYLSTATQARSGQPTNNATWADNFNTQFTDLEVIIEPWNTGELFDSWRAQANPVWTATSDANIWRNSSASVINFDYSNLDRMNAPRKLAEVSLAGGTSEADAIIALNNAYTLYSGLSDLGGASYNLGVAVRVSGSFTLIRLWDNRNPNGDTDLQPAVRTSGPAILCSAKSPTAFIVGMGLGGGNGPGSLFVRGTNGFRPQVTFVDSRLMGGGGAGSLAATGTVLATDGCDIISYRSMACGADQDGWNYHADTKFYEIDCGADWNGWNTTLTNNASTCHETARGVRVGEGGYLNAQDRAIHDVGPILSWNLGFTASTRRGADATATSAVYCYGIDGVAGSGSIYLDSVHISSGPAGPAQYTTQSNATAGSVLYANLDFTPVVGPSSTPGTLAAYTP